VIAAGEQRSWAVPAGCYDIQAVAEDNGTFCGHASYGVDIADGTTHVHEYTGCP
jgi:hypothetical protein